MMVNNESVIPEITFFNISLRNGAVKYTIDSINKNKAKGLVNTTSVKKSLPLLMLELERHYIKVSPKSKIVPPLFAMKYTFGSIGSKSLTNLRKGNIIEFEQQIRQCGDKTQNSKLKLKCSQIADFFNSSIKRNLN